MQYKKSKSKVNIKRAILALIVTLFSHGILLFMKDAPKSNNSTNLNDSINVSLLPMNEKNLRYILRHEPRHFLRSDSPYGYVNEGRKMLLEKEIIKPATLKYSELEIAEIEATKLSDKKIDTNLLPSRLLTFNISNLQNSSTEDINNKLLVYDEKSKKYDVKLNISNIENSDNIVGPSIITLAKSGNIIKLYLLSSSGVDKLDSEAMLLSEEIINKYSDLGNSLIFHWNFNKGGKSI